MLNDSRSLRDGVLRKNVENEINLRGGCEAPHLVFLELNCF
jgi:hypothetical protein